MIKTIPKEKLPTTDKEKVKSSVKKSERIKKLDYSSTVMLDIYY